MSQWVSLEYIFAAQSIVKKWKEAVLERENMKNALDELTDRLSDEWIAEWKELEALAIDERGDILRMYDVDETHGKQGLILH
jgi:hypothetical protein